MNRELIWHDVSACVAEGVQPVVFAHRNEDHVWRVCHSPICGSEPVSMVTVSSGDAVRIPLVPYASLPSLENLSGMLLELGTGLAAQAPNAMLLRIVVGIPIVDTVLEDGRPGWRVWVGFAWRIK